MRKLRARLLRSASVRQQAKPFQELHNLANGTMPEANKWAWSEFVIECLVPIVGIHPFPVDELLLMCSTVAYFRPDVIIEWGTHYGCSARVFYEIVRHLNLPTHIHSVDLPITVHHTENVLPADERARLVRDLNVRLHLGDGLEFATQIYQQRPAGLHLFFLDGDHSRQSVSRELAGLKILTNQAIVLVHDTFHQGPEADYNCGPHEAMLEFTALYGLPNRETLLGLPGMSLTYWRETK